MQEVLRVAPVRALATIAALTLFNAAAPSPARADVSPGDKARCKAAYESAQVLRRQEHLEAARAELTVCRETCPEPLIRQCARWDEEVRALVPSLRIEARGPAGEDLRDARVTIDGRPIDDPFSGPVDVEPGTHVVRFERTDMLSVEVRAEVHAGERGHLVRAALSRPPPVAPIRTEAPPPSTASPPPLVPGSRTPSYVLGAAGGVALVVAGVLSIKGQVDRADLRDGCAPRCDSDDVSAIRTTWWTAAGVAVFGAVALGVAVLLWPRSVSRIAIGQNLRLGGIALP
jgi:hypothetical protein